MGGFLGTIVIGLLANEAVNGVDASCCQFFTELFGVIYSMFVSHRIIKYLNQKYFIRLKQD